VQASLADDYVRAESENEPRSRLRPRTAYRLRAHTLLGVILLLGLALRVAWMVARVSVISPDGGEYATMAEHLLHQHALIGIYEGPEIIYGPLYPTLIAGVMVVIPNSETAAHVVSLVSGTALIVIVFLLAQRVYGRRTAYIAAALAAFHPLLIALSASVFNEALYATVWMAMAYWGIRALEFRRLRDAVFLGACVGLAYLTRVEALACLPFFAAALLFSGWRQKHARFAAVQTAIVCVVFLALASPYVAFLYRHTDHLRLEAKWNFNYTLCRNRLAGMSVIQANWGIGPNMTIEGPLLGPFQFADFTPYPHTLRERLGSLAAMARMNAQAVYSNLLHRQIGAPLLWALLVLGWCRAPWTNKRLRDEVLLFGLAALIVAATLIASSAETRYFFALVPMLLVWTANGLRELSRWITRWELMARWRKVRRDWCLAALQLGAAAMVVGIAIGGVLANGYFAAEHGAAASAAREAGTWLAQYGSPSKRIAVSGVSVVPYYAKGTLIAFPYGDPETTLRYIAHKQVDFIVLESAEPLMIPALGEWIAHGIPDPRAQIVYDKTHSPGVRVVIYQWRHM
jgi:4-amino-4-deoxy-L-arabinose transferase-like glycosyltransferase